MTDLRTTTATVTSEDGTTIAYRRLGEGPGLVLLHGAMQSGYSNIEFARELSKEHTCYVPDRRGRGSSAPGGDDYGVRKEVEDLDALLTATGARDVIGISSGAIIARRGRSRRSGRWRPRCTRTRCWWPRRPGHWTRIGRCAPRCCCWAAHGVPPTSRARWPPWSPSCPPLAGSSCPARTIRSPVTPPWAAGPLWRPTR
ncbi:alpha/beta fold hydrolase [Nonomuraea cavernae]|uniref:alpha/beta fold hydrolase n=1 Tax=Nonomuraea cavernae TaxID=2045107 RepID=UPI0033F2EB2C